MRLATRESRRSNHSETSTDVTSKEICKMIVQIVVLTLVQKPVVMTLPLCVVVVYFVQKYYLRTSRQLRVMELEARSALYSGFYETVLPIHPRHFRAIY
jgi:uncharacterized membrane protein YgcG